MNKPLRTVVFLTLSLCVFTAGCSSQSTTHDVSSMGPMPSTPPAGSRFAPAAAPTMTQDAFVTQLQNLPVSDRQAFIQANAQIMGDIMSGPDTPAKKKLVALNNKH